MKPAQENYQPSHPGLVVVDFQPGEFSSCLRTAKAFKAGEVITPLTGLTRGVKAYTSVQCGPGIDDHVELNSDLVYVNHSCEPNAVFDLSSTKMDDWHLRALYDLEFGDTLTFFYPSTEWRMDQAFQCHCGTKTCLGKIQGAAYIPTSVLSSRGFVNDYVLKLARERDAKNLKCPSCNHGAVAENDSTEDNAGLCGCKTTA